MSRLKEIWKLCLYEFRIEITSKRIWLGYLVGIVVLLSRCFGYFAYADSIGEPMNALEPYIIAMNDAKTVMFLVLGWLLVISEAPFISGNSLYLIYRTDKRNWNAAMLLYIILQAMVYYSVTAGAMALLGASKGYLANIWSIPLMRLTQDELSFMEFDVAFANPAFIREVSVFQAFFLSWLLAMLYGAVMGFVLYAFDLFSNRLIGTVCVFLFHFLGYEVMAEGLMLIIKFSLLARSVPSMVIGDPSVTLQGTVCIDCVLLLLLGFLSFKTIKVTDFKEISKGEGE